MCNGYYQYLNVQQLEKAIYPYLKYLPLYFTFGEVRMRIYNS